MSAGGEPMYKTPFQEAAAIAEAIARNPELRVHWRSESGRGSFGLGVRASCGLAPFIAQRST